jgi:hypothetical protein
MLMPKPEGWSKEDVLTDSGFGWRFYPPGSGGKGPHIYARPEDILVSMDLAAYVARSRRDILAQAGGAPVLHADRGAAICGGTMRGWYFEFTSHAAGGDLDTEEFVALVPGKGYIVTYDRRAGIPESPAARKALDSLCVQLS